AARAPPPAERADAAHAGTGLRGRLRVSARPPGRGDRSGVSPRGAPGPPVLRASRPRARGRDREALASLARQAIAASLTTRRVMRRVDAAHPPVLKARRRQYSGLVRSIRPRSGERSPG